MGGQVSAGFIAPKGVTGGSGAASFRGGQVSAAFISFLWDVLDARA